MPDRLRSYELMVLISPLHADPEGIERVDTRIRETISNANGEILAMQDTKPWGRRKLAYPIRAYAGGESSRRIFNEGYYILYTLQLDASQVDALERTIRLTDQILRHIVILADETRLAFLLDEEESEERAASNNGRARPARGGDSSGNSGGDTSRNSASDDDADDDDADDNDADDNDADDDDADDDDADDDDADDDADDDDADESNKR